MNTVTVILWLCTELIFCLTVLSTPEYVSHRLTPVNYYKETTTLYTAPALRLELNTHTVFNNYLELTITCPSDMNEDDEEECRLLSSFNSEYDTITDVTKVKLPENVKHKICSSMVSDHVSPLIVTEIPTDKINELNITHFHHSSIPKMNNLQSDWVHKLLDILLLTNTQAQGQWFGVLSLLVLVTGLSVTIFICLLLILHKYNIIEDNQIDESDDTRPLTGGMLFFVVISYITQLLYIIYIIIILTLLAYVIPTEQRPLISHLNTYNICVGTLIGYLSPRIYNNFGNKTWKMNIILTLILCPGVCISLLYTLQWFSCFKHDLVALPYSLLQIIILWLCVSIPFVFMGTYFAYCKQSIEHQARQNLIPSETIYIQTFPGYNIGEGYKPVGFVNSI